MISMSFHFFLTQFFLTSFSFFLFLLFLTFFSIFLSLSSILYFSSFSHFLSVIRCPVLPPTIPRIDDWIHNHNKLATISSQFFFLLLLFLLFFFSFFFFKKERESKRMEREKIRKESRSQDFDSIHSRALPTRQSLIVLFCTSWNR